MRAQAASAQAVAELLAEEKALAVSRHRPGVFGYGVAALVRPLVAIATAPWHVLAVRVADRVGKGIRSAPRDVLIANSAAKEETGRAFGFHRAMDHAGAVVGPLVATALLGLGWPLRTVFWVALVPGVLSVLAVLTVREPKVEQHASSNGDPSTTALKRLPGSLRTYLAILLLFSLGNSTDAFLLLRARHRRSPGLAPTALDGLPRRQASELIPRRRLVRSPCAPEAHRLRLDGLRGSLPGVRRRNRGVARVGALDRLRHLLRSHRASPAAHES